MKTKSFFAFFCALLLLVSILPAHGAEDAAGTPRNKMPGRDAPLWDKGPDPQAAARPLLRKISPGVIEIGNIKVNKPEGFVSVAGKVNMHEGLVEYLACGSRGKLHESVLDLDVSPYYLQVALLLIGLEPGEKPLEYQGAPGVPQGDPVEIWVSWEDGAKKRVRFRAEDLLLNVAEKKPMPHTHWVFTGSQVIDGRFMAEVEQSVAATYHDPFAIFDHPLPTGTDDTLYHVNTQVVPPKGTPVTFVVRSLKK